MALDVILKKYLSSNTVVDINIQSDGQTTIPVSDNQPIYEENKQKVTKFLRDYWDKLLLNFNYYLRTQTSPHRGDSFRWQGSIKNTQQRL